MKNLQVGDRLMTPKGVDFVTSVQGHWFSTRHFTDIPNSHESFRKLNIGEKIRYFFVCRVMGNHEWTSRAGEGMLPSGPPSEEGFWEYAAIYCRNCDKHSKLNRHAKSKKEGEEPGATQG